MDDSKVDVEFYLEEETIAQLDLIAKEKGCTRDNLIEEILREAVQEAERLHNSQENKLEK